MILSSVLQLRQSIVQDEERTESLKVQMQDLENKVQNVDAKIHQIETTLKDLRKLQEQISTKTAERRTLFKEQQRQYEALEEENEGLFYFPWLHHTILYLRLFFFWLSHKYRTDRHTHAHDYAHYLVSGIISWRWMLHVLYCFMLPSNVLHFVSLI